MKMKFFEVWLVIFAKLEAKFQARTHLKLFLTLKNPEKEIVCFNLHSFSSSATLNSRSANRDISTAFLLFKIQFNSSGNF
jgi:hypothetical protein